MEFIYLFIKILDYLFISFLILCMYMSVKGT